MMFEREGHVAATTSRSRSLKRLMTRTEEQLWRELRKMDVNFRRQAPIGRYFADFACHGRRLIVEVDGGVHQRLADVQLRDVERQRWLEGQGYRVMRFTDPQVHEDVYSCAEAVKKALLLDGGGLGGGASNESGTLAVVGVGAHPRPPTSSVATPPTPTLPPSRRKGA